MSGIASTRHPRGSRPDLRPYVTRLGLGWDDGGPDARRREVDGTLVLVDVTGSTRLAERLGRLGRTGAELTQAAINTVFEPMIGALLAAGADVLKFGGDAMLCLFVGEEHCSRAVQTAATLQRVVAEHGRVETPAGPVRLRVCVGVHTGRFTVMRTESRHRELLMFGPEVSATVRLQSAARPGQVLLSPAVAEAMPAAWLGRPAGPGRLARLGVISPSGARLARQARPSHSRGRTSATALVPVALRAVLGRDVHGEHRPLAMAFLTVRGTDDLLARKGPDAVVARLDEVAAAIDDAGDTYGVCWLKSDVGENRVQFLLVAGAPVLSEHDDERLLRAVRAIVERCNDVHVGVTSGPAFVGDVGHPDRRAYDVIGDAVNLAARLMARAEPGEILVEEPVFASGAMPFATAPLPPFSVKGKRFPVSARRLGEYVADAAEPARALPFVGRECDLAALVETLDAARSGHGGAVEVTGEPGIGKTRLVGELRAAARDVRWLQAGGDRYGVSSAYRAARALLADAIPSPRVLDRAVAAARPDLLPWLPLLGAVVGLDLPATDAVRRLDPALRRDRTNETLLGVLDVLLDEPTVFVLDDLQWCDDASVDLVQRLADVAARRQWLVVLTSRPGRARLEGVRRMRLDPISPGAAEQLVLAAVGDEPIAPVMVERLCRRSAGNPLFLRELASGAATPDDDLPATVERSIGARIDALSVADRRLLREAAVAGAVADLEVIASALDAPVLASPRRWASLGAFVGVDDAGVLRFRHDLVRTVAYQGLAHRRRRELHARLADEVARRAAPEATDAVAPLLAYHYHEAQQHDAAWRWALVAADAAQRAAAWVEAADLYATALRSADRLPGLSTADVAVTAEALGDVCERLGRHDEASSAYARGRRLVAGDEVATARLLRKAGRVDEKTGHYTSSLRRYGRGLRLLAEAGEGPEVVTARAELRLAYSVTRFFQGRFDQSIEMARCVLEDAGRVGDRRALAQAYLQLEMACSECRRPERVEYGERALALFDELGDDLGLGNLLLNLGVSAYNESDWGRALECYERAGAAYRRAGDVVGEASIRNNEAEILADQGHYDRAAQRLDEARRAYRAARYEMGVALTTSGRARLALRAGDHERALELLDDARERFTRLGAANFVVDTDIRRVECLVFAGRARGALALADATATALDESEPLAIVPITLRRLRGIALAQLGRVDEAAAELEAALDMARAEHVPFEVALVLASSAALARAGGPPVARGARSELRRLREELGLVDLPVPALP